MMQHPPCSPTLPAAACAPLRVHAAAPQVEVGDEKAQEGGAQASMLSLKHLQVV